MSWGFASAAALAALLQVGVAELAQSSEFNPPNASYIRVGGETSMPYGWMDFCNRRPEECNQGKLPERDVQLTVDAWALLNQVNEFANRTIEPVTNLDHWGTLLDHWDYPVDGMGDCKVYALYKRKLLIERGLPRQALLMTIVRDLSGHGHAILTVKTDHGEFVLDNLTDQIRPWDSTGYRYVKRQAQADPNVWLDLGGVIGGYHPNPDNVRYVRPPREPSLVAPNLDSARAVIPEDVYPEETRLEWSAQISAARARHDSWLQCVREKASNCDQKPEADRPKELKGRFVDDGLPPLNVG
jgi:predicted transglutaminase-like cysteine proteinase